MRNRLAVALVVLALLIGVGIALTIGLLIKRSTGGRTFPNTATVVQQIQSLSELVTVKYVVEKVVPYEDVKYFADLVPLGENKVILLAHGIVKAGVDLSQVQAGDVEVNATSISITLPAARVTDAYLDEKHTQVLDRQTGLFRSFDKGLEQKVRQYALAEVSRGARQNGIEREANERARAQLTGFLKAIGFTEVEVRTGGR